MSDERQKASMDWIKNLSDQRIKDMVEYCKDPEMLKGLARQERMYEKRTGLDWPSPQETCNAHKAEHKARGL